MQFCYAFRHFLTSTLLPSRIVEPLRLLIVHIFKTKLERFDTTEFFELQHTSTCYSRSTVRGGLLHRWEWFVILVSCNVVRSSSDPPAGARVYINTLAASYFTSSEGEGTYLRRRISKWWEILCFYYSWLYRYREKPTVKSNMYKQASQEYMYGRAKFYQ